MIRAWRLALGLLTRIPVAAPVDATLPELGRSVLFFPLVGLLLGGGLVVAADVAAGIPPLLAAALVLALWVGVTGALHLDGLADTVDGWAGGAGDRARTLALLKDPHAGPMAVVALVLHLLVKFACIETLLASGRGEVLWWPPVGGRLALLSLFLTTPYARPGGMGEAHVRHLPRRAAVLVLALCLLPLPWLPPGWIGMGMVLAGTGLARRAFMRRLGGTTGDTAGAVCELVETLALLGLVLAD